MSPYRSVVFEYLRFIIKESDMFFMCFSFPVVFTYEKLKIITVRGETFTIIMTLSLLINSGSICHYYFAG
jgi:hypothetical protein